MTSGATEHERPRRVPRVRRKRDMRYDDATRLAAFARAITVSEFERARARRKGGQ